LVPGIVSENDIILFEKAEEYSLFISSHNSDLSQSSSKIPLKSIVIIPYGMVSALKEHLTEYFSNHVIIVDESHYMKNIKAKRTATLVPLIQSASRAILLSGTPALSRPLELYTQLKSLSPQSWPNEKEFAARYGLHKKTIRSLSKHSNSKQLSALISSHSQELHVLLRGTTMIRRLKKDVLSELPRKVRNLVKFEISDQIKRNEIKYVFIHK
jgi:SNF2 family DNA or RNA helicase